MFGGNCNNNNSTGTARRRSTSVKARAKKDYIDCEICLEKRPRKTSFRLMNCNHEFCESCMETYVQTCVSESKIDMECPLPSCNNAIHPKDIKKGLQDCQQYHKYERFMVRKVLMKDPDARWCPKPNCSFAVLAPDCSACPELQCLDCGTHFCYSCRQEWHPKQSCVESLVERSIQGSGPADDPVKFCPKCNVPITKEGWTCNHIVCTMCRTNFCWRCLNCIDASGIHFLSTKNNCPMYGEAATTRFFKHLFLAALWVGAPLGIPGMTLLCAIGVVFTLPYTVFVEVRKSRSFHAMPGHKQVLVIAGSVVLAILFSPLMAVISFPVIFLWLLKQVYFTLPMKLWYDKEEFEPAVARSTEEVTDG